MPLTLILMRHGNTFDKGDTILRVGARTDLPLSSSGREQARKLGEHFAAQKLRPDLVFTSTLKRTIETATLALQTADYQAAVEQTPDLDEIDYGVDDGKPETDVVARLGEEALENWEKNGVMPIEWSPRPAHIQKQMDQLKDQILSLCTQDRNVFVWLVTSNGIARFFAEACRWDCPRPDTLKLSTGAYAHLEYTGKDWHIKGWNIRPS